VSPIFKIYRDSPWRDHVAVMWEFLEDHYDIASDFTCSTHIHVSLCRPTYNARDIRKIAAASIYFEPALEALVPSHRKLNSFCKSNYINGPAGAKMGKSRLELIHEVEKKHLFKEILPLLQPNTDKNFCWNFLSHDLCGTVEFRKPPPSETRDEALSWAEYVMEFVQASLLALPGKPDGGRGIADELQDYSPDVGGLKRFLSRGQVKSVSQPWRLERLWRGHDDSEAVEPLVILSPKDILEQLQQASSSS
jgi:Putative amidoligase enzyme